MQLFVDASQKNLAFLDPKDENVKKYVNNNVQELKIRHKEEKRN